MLRASDKRLHVGERLPLIFGGRASRRYPDLKPPRLSGPTAPPVASPAAWWDASVLSSLTISSVGKVTAWADLSGNGLNCTVNNTPWAVIQPNRHYGRLTLNGDLMDSSNGLSASDRTQTVFWCGMVNSLAAARCMFGSSGNGGRLFRVETTGRLACVKRNDANLFVASAALTVTAGTPFAACLILDTSTIELRLNAVTPESTSESTTFTAALTTFLHGGDASLAGRLPGYCCEAIAYDGAMASADATATMGYLMSKWGIA